MFFINALLAGGLLYTGIKAYQEDKKIEDVVSNAKEDEPSKLFSNLEEEAPSEVLEEANHYLSMSSLSLGLATTGSLVYRPFILASIPATIYVTLPIFKKGYQALFSGKSGKTALFNSILVIGTLTSGHYFIPAFLDWSYHFVRKSWLQTKSNLKGIMVNVMRKTQFVWVRVEEGEVEIPREQLNIGDIIVVSENDIIPIGGTITDGSATIGQYFVTGDSEPIEKSVGDQVFPASYVLSGKVYIRVESMKI